MKKYFFVFLTFLNPIFCMDQPLFDGFLKEVPFSNTGKKAEKEEEVTDIFLEDPILLFQNSPHSSKKKSPETILRTRSFSGSTEASSSDQNSTSQECLIGFLKLKTELIKKAECDFLTLEDSSMSELKKIECFSKYIQDVFFSCKEQLENTSCSDKRLWELTFGAYVDFIFNKIIDSYESRTHFSPFVLTEKMGWRQSTHVKLLVAGDVILSVLDPDRKNTSCVRLKPTIENHFLFYIEDSRSYLNPMGSYLCPYSVDQKELKDYSYTKTRLRGYQEFHEMISECLKRTYSLIEDSTLFKK